MTDRTRLVTTRDIIIPAGTPVHSAPTHTHYISAHGQAIVAFDKDRTGDLRLDLQEAMETGLVGEAAHG